MGRVSKRTSRIMLPSLNCDIGRARGPDITKSREGCERAEVHLTYLPFGLEDRLIFRGQRRPRNYGDTLRVTECRQSIVGSSKLNCLSALGSLVRFDASRISTPTMRPSAS